MTSRLSVKLLAAAVLTVAMLPVASRAQAPAAPVFSSVGGPAYKVVTVVEGLQDPWSFAFLPGGDMLVTEKPGRLRLVRNGVLQPEPIDGVPATRYQRGGQGGLLEVALHPDFATNRVLYLTHTKVHADGKQLTTALVRARLEGNRLVDSKELFEAKAWSETNGHFGGRIALDGRGYLFLTVGDRLAAPQRNQESHPAQLLSSHQGKILRLHDDGRVPADNPFVARAGALPEIWSYGHRNLQGLTIHPQTGELWATEHGPQGGDELNVILPGRNYGWPVIGYGKDYGGARLHASVEKDGMEQPIQFWTPVIAPSGLMVYTGDRFPRWKGSMFVGGLTGQQLVRLTLAGTDGHQIGVMDRPHLMMGYGRIRDVRQGPDGYIYLALDGRYDTSAQKIVRLEPATP
jgi:glucose/arabinose dehydrogenase